MPESSGNNNSSSGGFSYKSSGTNSQVCGASTSTTTWGLGPRQQDWPAREITTVRETTAREPPTPTRITIPTSRCPLHMPRRFPQIANGAWVRTSDGSYYYSNPNGSTYYNNGRGDSTYTPPSNGGKKWSTTQWSPQHCNVQGVWSTAYGLVWGEMRDRWLWWPTLPLCFLRWNQYFLQERDLKGSDNPHPRDATFTSASRQLGEKTSESCNAHQSFIIISFFTLWFNFLKFNEESVWASAVV